MLDNLPTPILPLGKKEILFVNVCNKACLPEFYIQQLVFLEDPWKKISGEGTDVSSVMSPLMTPHAQVHSFIVTLTQMGLVKLCVTHIPQASKTQNKRLETIGVGS